MTNFDSSIYQTSSVSNSNTFTSGSAAEKLERFSAFTAEVDIIVPHKIPEYRPGYFITSFLSSSIYGFHQAISSSVSDYTWPTNETANLQVYLVRDKESPKRKIFIKKPRWFNIFNIKRDKRNIRQSKMECSSQC